MYAWALRGWGTSGTGYEWQRPLAQATGDQTIVWATGGWAPLTRAIGSGGLSLMWCPLGDLQMAGTNHSNHLRNQREA